MPHVHKSALEPILSAFYSTLNVAAMTALATNGVLNNVPPGTLPPYLVIRPVSDSGFGQLGRPGASHLIDLRSVSAAKSDLENIRMLSQAKELLLAGTFGATGTKMTISGYHVVGIQPESGGEQFYEELVGNVLIRHAVHTYRVTVEQLST